MRMRTGAPDGLLFWVSEEETSPYSDYLSLGLKDGLVQFGYNLGSGEVVIAYEHRRVDDNKWHVLRIQR